MRDALLILLFAVLAFVIFVWPADSLLTIFASAREVLR